MTEESLEPQAFFSHGRPSNNSNGEEVNPESSGELPISQRQASAFQAAWLERRLLLVLYRSDTRRKEWLRQWIGQTQLPVAWLSLELADNSSESFFNHLAASLRSAFPELLGLMMSPSWGNASLEGAMVDLINACLLLPGHFWLILDGYQVISALPIHQAVTMLMDYLPPRMHVLLTCQGEPALPLAHWRARRQMVAINIG